MKSTIECTHVEIKYNTANTTQLIVLNEKFNVKISLTLHLL